MPKKLFLDHFIALMTLLFDLSYLGTLCRAVVQIDDLLFFNSISPYVQ